MKSFIASLLLGPVVATNGATLRRLQFPDMSSGGGFMGGVLADIVSGDSDAAPAQSRHCKDALAHSCDRTGASGPRDNFAYTYDPNAVVGEQGGFAKAMQEGRMGGEGASQPAMPALFAGAGTPPAGPPSPPWAQTAEEGEEPKLTVRQKFQAQFGLEVTADPYGVPAPDTPASPFGEAPASPFGEAPASPFGEAPASPFGAVPESPFAGAAAASPFAGVMASSPFGGAADASSPFAGIGASLGGGVGAGANVGSLLRGGVAAQAVAPQAATPKSQTQQTGNMTPEQRKRAMAIAAASASDSSSSNHNAILPSASRY